jgi:hypothetical protein
LPGKVVLVAGTTTEAYGTIAGFQSVTGGTQTTLAIKLNNWTMTATTGRIKTIVRYT